MSKFPQAMDPMQTMQNASHAFAIKNRVAEAEVEELKQSLRYVEI